MVKNDGFFTVSCIVDLKRSELFEFYVFFIWNLVERFIIKLFDLKKSINILWTNSKFTERKVFFFFRFNRKFCYYIILTSGIIFREYNTLNILKCHIDDLGSYSYNDHVISRSTSAIGGKLAFDKTKRCQSHFQLRFIENSRIYTSLHWPCIFSLRESTAALI